MRISLTSLSRAQKRAVLLLTDAGLVAPSLALALFLRDAPSVAGDMLRLAPCLALVTVAAAALALRLGIADTRVSAYEGRALTRTAGLSGLLSATFAAAAMSAGTPVPSTLAIIFGVVFCGLSAGSRAVMFFVLTWAYRRGTRRTRVLIYGAGATGLQLARALGPDPEVEAVGFVDDNAGLHGLRIAGLKVFAPVRLGDLAARLAADLVILAMPSLSPPRRAARIAGLEAQGLSVSALPSFAQLTRRRSGAAYPRELLPQPRPVPALRAEAAGCYAGRRVLVTGAGGSIGAELARQILALKPARLVLLDLGELALFRVEAALKPLAEAAGIPLVPVLGSAADGALMARVLTAQGVDTILHCAAYKHVPMVEANPAAGLANNVLGTEALMRAAIKAGVARFVLISSDKAVRPAGLMGATKWMAEQVVRDLAARAPGLRAGIVRFGNVLGSSGSVVPLMQEQVRRGGPVTITDPRMERYFMSADEAVHLVLEAGSMADRGEVFLFDMGPPMRIVDLARKIIRAEGYAPRDSANPDGDIDLTVTGLRPGEKLREDLTWTGTRTATAHERIFTAADPALSEIETAQMLRQVRRAVAEGRGLALAEIKGLATPGDAARGHVA